MNVRLNPAWRGSRNALLLGVTLVAALAGCATQRVVPPATPPATAQPSPAAPVEAAPKSSSWTVDGYKKDAARSIYEANRKYLYDGAPPPVLKSVVVLSITIDPDGQPTRVAVLRSNGYNDLDKLALQSVQRAAPLPLPSRMILRRGGLEYTETWLFREDGRFQIRSLAEVQQTGLD
jgi:periplasmic protein TonB